MYFDMKVAPNHGNNDEDLSYDDYAVNHNYVVVTPLDMDVTAYAHIERFIAVADTDLNPTV